MSMHMLTYADDTEMPPPEDAIGIVGFLFFVMLYTDGIWYERERLELMKRLETENVLPPLHVNVLPPLHANVNT